MSPKADDFVGRALPGGYRIDRFVAAGGFAWVYEGVAPGSDGKSYRCAIKIPYNDAQHAFKRFVREIKVLRALPPNDNCVRYMGDGFTQENLPFLAMEFVDGITLNTGLRRRPVWQETDACTVMAQLCASYSGQHKLGLANRDVKPDNIMLTRQMQVKVMDFGLVKDAQGLLKLFEEEDILSGYDFAENLDRGILAGSPDYMAPEQFSDTRLEDPALAETDTWTDVYSLGLIFYQMLTGTKLFALETSGDPQLYPRELLGYLKRRIDTKDEDIIRPPPISADVWPILERALRREPRRRFRTASEMGAKIGEYLLTGAVHREVDDRTFVASHASILAAHLARAAQPASVPQWRPNALPDTSPSENPARKVGWSPSDSSATPLHGMVLPADMVDDLDYDDATVALGSVFDAPTKFRKNVFPKRAAEYDESEAPSAFGADPFEDGAAVDALLDAEVSVTTGEVFAIAEEKTPHYRSSASPVPSRATPQPGRLGRPAARPAPGHTVSPAASPLSEAKHSPRSLPLPAIDSRPHAPKTRPKPRRGRTVLLVFLVLITVSLLAGAAFVASTRLL